MPQTIEEQIRSKYDRRIICCLKVEASTFLIGFIDLSFQLLVLIAELTVPKVPAGQVPSPQPHLHIGSDLASKRSAASLSTPGSYNYTDDYGYQCLTILFIGFTMIITLNMIVGVVKKKPGLLAPYLFLKIFDLISSLLSPVISIVVASSLLASIKTTDNSITFGRFLPYSNQKMLAIMRVALILIIVLIKVGVIVVVHRCYRLLTALNSARSGLSSSDILSEFNYDHPSTTDRNNDQYQPPTYEDIVKQNIGNTDGSNPAPSYTQATNDFVEVQINDANQRSGASR